LVPTTIFKLTVVECLVRFLLSSAAVKDTEEAEGGRELSRVHASCTRVVSARTRGVLRIYDPVELSDLKMSSFSDLSEHLNAEPLEETVSAFLYIHHLLSGRWSSGAFGKLKYVWDVENLGMSGKLEYVRV
jgi:hypothetical protein